MRLSSVTVLAILPFSLAAPILSNRDFNFGDVANIVKGVANGNGTLAGLAGNVGKAVANPKLDIARAQVVAGLASSTASLKKIGAQAKATDNANVTSLVSDAQQGITAAQDGVDRIGATLVSGGPPSKADEKDVAVGINAASTAINSMSDAITTPDAQLSKDVAGGVKNVAALSKGAQGVLAAAGLTLADLGLPDDELSA